MSTARISNSPVDIAVSGLRAQSRRMNVIAGNIANANTSRAEDGGPYRRQEVVLRTDPGEKGVTVGDVLPDLQSEFKRVYLPGHPDADEKGWVRMPNVELPREMVDLVLASRAYQANAAVLKRYQDIMEATIELLK